jgi:hypothetical protein
MARIQADEGIADLASRYQVTAMKNWDGWKILENARGKVINFTNPENR